MGLLAKIQHSASRKAAADYTWVGEKLEKLFLADDQVQTDRWTQEQDWFRPSSLTYKWGSGVCARYWYYIFHKYPRFSKNDVEGVARMGHGTKRHSVLQDKFAEFEEFVEIERELKLDNPTLRGSCDLVLLINGEEEIGEIKTTKQETWFKRQLEGPPYYNILQLCLYMYMAGVNRGFLLIENNNNQEVLLFPVEFTDKLRADVEKLLEWMRTVEVATKGTEGAEPLLPERCFTKSSYNCKACPFKKECWSGPEGDILITKSPAFEEGATK